MREHHDETIKMVVRHLEAKMEAMEERYALKLTAMEERLKSDNKVTKWGIGLILAVLVPLLAKVYVPGLGTALFGQ